MNPRVGATKWPEYRVWNQMRQRCDNPRNEKYPAYGGRGISVCERWKNFLLFIEDMGRRPSPKLTIERVDINGNYEPSNCIWATHQQQARNRRRNHIVTIGDRSECLQYWCDKVGVAHANALRSARKGGQIADFIIRVADKKRISLDER